ncbi:MAG: hypothetical protein ACLTZY_00975 [Alistipes indistinctus]
MPAHTTRTESSISTPGTFAGSVSIVLMSTVSPASVRTMMLFIEASTTTPVTVCGPAAPPHDTSPTASAAAKNMRTQLSLFIFFGFSAGKSL